MALAILYLLAIWVWLWLVCFGWGLLAYATSRCRREDAVSLMVVPWVGAGLVIAVLQLWHFAAAINGWTLGAVSVVGMLSAATLGGRQLALLAKICRERPTAVVISMLLVVWLVNRSLNSQEYTDHGLYYLNAIRWNTDYPVVLGLGNLHDRLAFNNSNFLLHAMLEVGPWRGYSAHLVNGFLAALAVPIIVHGIGTIVYGGGRERHLGWFVVAIGMLVATSAVDRNVSSASTDFPAMLIVTVAAWRWLATGVIAAEAKGDLLRWNLLAFAVLTTAAVTIKLSVMFFAAFGWLFVAVAMLCWRRRRPELATRSIVTTAATMLIWAAVLFVPWVGRGYVLSGCPLFPSTIGRLPVDWAVSPEATRDLRQRIYAWARTTHLDRDIGFQETWAWVPQWFVQVVVLRSPIEIVAPVAISLACVLWLTHCRMKSSPKTGGPVESNLIPSLLAVAYVLALACWFLTAPAARLGTFACWGLAGIMLGLVSQTSAARLAESHRRLLLTALILLHLLPTMHDAFLIETRYRYRPKMPEFGSHFYQYQPFVLPTTESGFPAMPQGKLLAKTTKSGLVVYVGEDSGEEMSLLWDSPLPAASSFNPQLALRRPGDLRSGFNIVTATPDQRDRAGPD